MSNLKDLTWEHHQEAERQQFVKVLMSGKIHPEFYATYLWNQHMKYDLLEALVSVTSKVNHIEDIYRKQYILDDFRELWPHENPPKTVASTLAFVEHLKGIMHEPELLVAHMYTLHMGDLSGGQMIKRKVPGQGKMYNFKGDVQQTKTQIRELVNDDMADEARKCFSFATDLFKELMEIPDVEHYMEQTD
jgi:heme oxygenase